MTPRDIGGALSGVGLGDLVAHGTTSPLVGRTRELGELRDALESVMTSCEPCTVTIVGSSGIGKTRLLGEFLRQLRNELPEVRSYRGFTRENAPPYAIFNRILKARFGIVEGSESSTVHEHFRRQVSSILGDQRVTEFLHFLGSFLDLKFPGSPFIQAVEDNPEQRHELTRTILKRFFEVDALSGPLILTFEDIQWAHDDSLDLIRFLSDKISHSRVMIVCITTPDLFYRRPDWFESETTHRRLELAPLNKDDSQTLLSNLLSRVDSIPEELLDTAFEMAGGNPYFVEQVVRILLENGTIEVADDDRWVLHLENLDSAQLPLTVADAVQARIAALNTIERLVLEQASVIGSVFWLGSLVVMGRSSKEPPDLWGGSGDLAPHLQDTLDSLVERDYLMQMPDSTFPGDVEYVFKHNLEREMIRRMVSPSLARSWHLLLAQWLEFRVPDHSEEFLDMLAMNYEKGGDDLTAGRYYLVASSAARERYANRKAAEYARRGLDLIGNLDLLRRVDALHDLGDVLQRMGELDQAFAVFQEMQQIAWKLDMKSKGGAAHNRIGRVHRETGRLDEALRHLGTGLALFDATGDQRGVASSLDDIGKVHWMRGEYDLALRQMRDALKIRRQLGDMRSIALSLNNMGLVHHDSGRFQDALEAFNEALTLRREVKDLPGQVGSLNNIGTVCRDNGDFEKAIELWQEALRIARRIDDRVWQAYLLINMGEAQNQIGWYDDAVKTLTVAEEISVQLGDHLVIGESFRVLGETFTLRGDVAKGREYAMKALEQFESLRSKVHIGTVLRTIGEITAAGGWGEEEIQKAIEYFERSIKIFEEIGNELELARSCRAYANLLSQSGQVDKGEQCKKKSDEIFAKLASSSVAIQHRAILGPKSSKLQ